MLSMKIDTWLIVFAGVILTGIASLLRSWKPRPVPEHVRDMFPADGTSVYCRGNTTNGRLCHFRNMCYSHTNEEFLFVHGPKSKIVSVPDQRYSQILVLLSCSYDNYDQFHYLDVTAGYFSGMSNQKYIYRPGKHFMYSRTAPRNIMHMFHDEVMPLFFTFLRHSELQDKSRVRLLVKDKGSSGANPCPSLYEMFTNQEVVFMSELEITDLDYDYSCFEDIYVGLADDSTWHQFGYKTPEGPIPDAVVTGQHVKLFTNHVKNNLGIRPDCPAEEFGVFLSRKKNRLILNDKDLIGNISKVMKVPVIDMSLEEHPVRDIIAKVSCARMAIGVHGALLILSMFLPRHSLLLEIFPYAINPDHRCHYRTLVELGGMNIEYVSWRNMDRSMSVAHPDKHPQGGGIRHLSNEEQEQILRSTEVPHHKNSIESEWRYYIFQDTIVDINAIVDLLRESELFRR